MKVVLYLDPAIWQGRVVQLTSKYSQVTFVFAESKERIPNDCEVLITSHGFKPEDLEDKKRLKLILVPFTGINQLPLSYLNKRNITVCNTHVHASVVAERGLALGLALLGRVVELDERLRKGWHHVGDRTWVSLFGKRVGILGMGAIGQALYRLLQPFQIELITLRRYEPRLKPLGIQATYFDSVEDVCLYSDLIYNILPLTSKTERLLDAKLINRLHGKFLINIGRGPTIDEAALYRALRDGILRGGAFDVWYQYQDNEPSAFPFHELSNVVLSPHCAGMAEKSDALMMEDTLRNLERYLNGEPLDNVVRLEAEY